MERRIYSSSAELGTITRASISEFFTRLAGAHAASTEPAAGKSRPGVQIVPGEAAGGGHAAREGQRRLAAGAMTPPAARRPMTEGRNVVQEAERVVAFVRASLA